MGAVLVTGAAGYIGSHACLELLEAGYDVVGLDNYDNSSPEAIRRVEELAGRSLVAMYEMDLRDREKLNDVFSNHEIDSVMHFAGLKAVGESVAEPMLYYDTNIGSTLALIGAMSKANVKKMVFSSSCTVYGSPTVDQVPLTEQTPLHAVSPYGRTKLLIEEMLSDLCAADPEWSTVSLRYFNPIGAHSSGRIGDAPNGVPNNLLPYIMQVAVGLRDALQVFGDDYPTSDGTCIRDYIHVVDLARGHLDALGLLEEPGFTPINLGTGVGSSVLDVVNASSKAVGREIPYEIKPRRAGDATAVYANPQNARDALGWKAKFDLNDMCVDHWNWQKNNPQGY